MTATAVTVELVVTVFVEPTAVTGAADVAVVVLIVIVVITEEVA